MSDRLHSWNVNETEAVAIQDRLAEKIILTNGFGRITGIAGCDVAYDLSSGKAFAAVCVFSWPELSKIDEVAAITDITFPYVPGLLAFREGPPLLSAFELLAKKPTLVLFNGQGIAHPRRMGLATHLGIIMDMPSIGCARENLHGQYSLAENHKGAYSEITDDSEIIGACLRTQKNIKPVFVSQGYKTDLETAIRIILACTTRFKMPEPLRAAHMTAGEERKKWTENPGHH